MSGRRMLLAGRVAGAPLSIAGLAGGFGELVTLAVPDGAGSRLWAAFRGPAQRLEHPIADGDVIAVVGTVDPSRNGAGALHGPIVVDAVLGLGVNGWSGSDARRRLAPVPSASSRPSTRPRPPSP